MRAIEKVYRAVPTMEGAGVRLKRVFGYAERGLFDPFLLLDHFGSDDPADYLAGFPWHPHRGIETVTYLLESRVRHGDSMGNRGVIGPGDAQWMTAGSGIVHEEMPEAGPDGRMEGFQLWVNLPAALKMTTPRYRAVAAAEVPVLDRDGAEISVLAGDFEGVPGATPELFIPVRYLIVRLAPGAATRIPVPSGDLAAAYLFRGAAEFAGTSSRSGRRLSAFELGRFSDGDSIGIKTPEGASFLLISGVPLGEPIAWGGPIVMNTREELRTAFEEYERGTFIKAGS
jgi:redox-sensitive bicupin YhaK (pirin superfamily)